MTTPRALLVGSQTYGLSGANSDVAAVEAALALRGFKCRSLIGEEASRCGVLDGFRALIHDTVPGDPVLVYYSGHGGRIANPRHRPEAPEEPRHYACIIPTDHEQGEDGAFRGIFSAELSALVAELSLRTGNITVILDCCHAAAVVKGEMLRPKAIPIPWRDRVAEHRDWLLSQGYDLSARAGYVEGNPYAVRLFACAPEQTAFEACREDGSAGGLLTNALVDVLGDSAFSEGTQATWQALALLVKQHVTDVHEAQVPEIHGPLGRTLFSIDSSSHTGILALEEHGGEPYLGGGSLQGVMRGSRYLFMPPNANRADPGLAIGEAEVMEDPEVDRARIAFISAATDQAPPLGTRAFPHELELVRHPVWLDVPPGILRNELAASVNASPRLCVASDEMRPLATVRLDGQSLKVLDREGNCVRAWWPALPAPVSVLEQLARVSTLLEQSEPVGMMRLLPDPTLRWGVVGDDGVIHSPLRGAQLCEGSRIFLSVMSHNPAPVFVNVLGVGVSRSIRLLSGSKQTGVRLETQQTYTLGRDGVGRLLGVPLVWSADVPRGAPQPMQLVVVISERGVDLRSLESSAESVFLGRNVDDLLSPAMEIATKDFGAVPETAVPMRYSWTVIHFSLFSEERG